MKPSRGLGAAAVCARSRARGDHRVEQRQADRGAERREERCGGTDAFFVMNMGYFFLIWNGALRTMPTTIDENR